MGQNVRYLHDIIRRYGLDRRSREARNALMLIERGMLSDNVAKAFVIRFQPLIDKLERRPNFLFRAPDYEELYGDESPKLVIGHLEENEDVPLGLFPRGAFHCLFVGMSGAGKSVAIRRLVMAIEELNRHRDRPFIVFPVCRSA